MKEYLEQLKFVLENGTRTEDRTGVGTLSVFGMQTRYDLSRGFPAVTTKKLWFKGVVHELLWFLSGSTNIKYLVENNVHIWDAWADENGELGPVYGAMWRSWPDHGSKSIDQIKNLVDGLKGDPYSRRHVVSAWNPALLTKQALPPCHTLFQFHVRRPPVFAMMHIPARPGEELDEDQKRYNEDIQKPTLDCQLYQRSADMFLGVPFNIASYALLTHMLAQVCGMRPGHFVHTLGDAHIYLNHRDQVREQLSREPMAKPRLWLNPTISEIDAFTHEDIRLEGYKHHPAIRGDVAV